MSTYTGVTNFHKTVLFLAHFVYLLLNRTRSTDMHTGYTHSQGYKTVNYKLKLLVQTQTDSEKN